MRHDVEDAANQQPGVLADAQRAGRRGLFHARGDVDSEAADGRLLIDATAKQHRPGMDADANVAAVLAVFALHALAEGAALVEQFEAAAHGALAVILARLLGAERRQQVVARVLQHLAAVRTDDRGAALEDVVDHSVHLFGIEMLAERGRADDVKEQNRHLSQDLLGRRARHRMRQPHELLAHRRERCVDDRIAEQGALSLQRGNRRFQRCAFAHAPLLALIDRSLCVGPSSGRLTMSTSIPADVVVPRRSRRGSFLRLASSRDARTPLHASRRPGPRVPVQALTNGNEILGPARPRTVGLHELERRLGVGSYLPDWLVRSRSSRSSFPR